jgi:hypothetical protein
MLLWSLLHLTKTQAVNADASAPLKELQKRFVFEPGRVVATTKELLGRLTQP